MIGRTYPDDSKELVCLMDSGGRGAEHRARLIA